MFDKYFCKRLHAKKITLDMIAAYGNKWIANNPLMKECIVIAYIFMIAGYIIKFSSVVPNIQRLIFACILAPILYILAFTICGLFCIYIAPKIQVASCPLTKTGGN